MNSQHTHYTFTVREVSGSHLHDVQEEFLTISLSQNRFGPDVPICEVWASSLGHSTASRRRSGVGPACLKVDLFFFWSHSVVDWLLLGLLSRVYPDILQSCLGYIDGKVALRQKNRASTHAGMMFLHHTWNWEFLLNNSTCFHQSTKQFHGSILIAKVWVYPWSSG